MKNYAFVIAAVFITVLLLAACSDDSQPRTVMAPRSDPDATVAAVLTMTTARLTATAVVQATAIVTPFRSVRSAEIDPNMINRRMGRYRSPAIRGAQPTGPYAHVIRIVTGDTLDVRFDTGVVERVRLIGVDTPEVLIPNQPGVLGTAFDPACLEVWGHRAFEFATEALLGWPVVLQFDDSVPGKETVGQILAYVHTGAGDFNADLVARGLARVYTPHGSSRTGRYHAFEDEAIAQGLGLWSCQAEN